MRMPPRHQGRIRSALASHRLVPYGRRYPSSSFAGAAPWPLNAANSSCEAASFCADEPSWHKPPPRTDRSAKDAPGRGRSLSCRGRRTRWLALRRSSEKLRRPHVLFASPGSAFRSSPFAAVDGRRHRIRRGPLATRCLCPAIQDAASCWEANPVTVVGFMSGIATSTA